MSTICSVKNAVEWIPFIIKFDRSNKMHQTKNVEQILWANSMLVGGFSELIGEYQVLESVICRRATFLLPKVISVIVWRLMRAREIKRVTMRDPDRHNGDDRIRRLTSYSNITVTSK